MPYISHENHAAINVKARTTRQRFLDGATLPMPAWPLYVGNTGWARGKSNSD